MPCSCVAGANKTKSFIMSLFSRKMIGSFPTMLGRTVQNMNFSTQGFTSFHRNYYSLSHRFAVLKFQHYSKALPRARSLYKSGFQNAKVFSKNNVVQMISRMKSTGSSKSNTEKSKSIAMYIVSIAILVGGGSYAAVPLYRLYCQTSGYGGTVKVADVGDKIENMKKQTHRVLKVKFNADTGATMQWSFRPQQREIKIVPGETALAFYTAKNPTDVPITGVSTYNVIPFEAGQYFNKIQCFCFEEQRLNPGEEVDMPVFFYIDPEYVLDPSLAKVNEITLSYTFFEAKEISWPDLQNYKK